MKKFAIFSLLAVMAITLHSCYFYEKYYVNIFPQEGKLEIILENICSIPDRDDANKWSEEDIAKDYQDFKNSFENDSLMLVPGKKDGFTVVSKKLKAKKKKLNAYLTMTYKSDSDIGIKYSDDKQWILIEKRKNPDNELVGLNHEKEMEHRGVNYYAWPINTKKMELIMATDSKNEMSAYFKNDRFQLYQHWKNDK